MNQDYMELLQAFGQFHKLNMKVFLPGISHGQFVTLQAIHCLHNMQEGVKVQQVAKYIDSSMAGVSRTLRELEEQGLLQRSVDVHDRRNVFVELTARGEEVLKEGHEGMKTFADVIFSHIDSEDLKMLIHCLNQIYEVGREEIKRKEAEHE